MVDPEKTESSERHPGEETSDRLSLPATAPRRISHYRLRRVIATGGMGTVYEAQQDQPRRAVAVKVLTRGVSSPSALRRFQQESQILGRLRHPGIAQVYEAGMYEDPATPGAPAPFFALEYIPNARTLTDYAQSKGLGTTQKLELFRQVCDAVHYGHVQGVIHRDLKPGNILVDSTGRVKVIDFGVARTTDSDLAVTTQQTMEGQLVGTLQYMAPEQVEGDLNAIDARCDVYALGVVLYELLSERMPYDILGKPFYEVTRVIRECPPTPASSVDTSFRGDIDTILQTALQKDPDRRYASVQALQSDIERYLHGQPIEARRNSAWYVARTQVRRGIARHPAVSTLGAALLAVTLAWWPVVPVVHEWTPAGRWADVVMTQWFGPAGSISTLERVRLLVLNLDEEDAEALAAREQLEGVSPATHGRSLRRLHGRMMEKLVRANPRVVVWDMRFPGAPDPIDQPFTDDFIAGARALQAAGVPVVIGTDTWDPEQMGPGAINPDIAAAVHVGGLGAHMGPTQPWGINLIVEKEQSEPVPSLALAAAAWAERPHADGIAFRIDGSQEFVQARAWMHDQARPSRRRPIDSDLRFTLSAPIDWDHSDDLGIDAGDLVARFVVDMPSNVVLNEATIPYGQVLGASDDRRREWFSGRAVVLWIGKSTDELGGHPDGRSLHYYQGQAVAVDQLLAGAAIRYGRPLHNLVTIPAAAVLGILVACATFANLGLRLAMLAILTVSAVGASLLAYGMLHYVSIPIVPVLAMIIAAELSAAALRIRAEKHY